MVLFPCRGHICIPCQNVPAWRIYWRRIVAGVCRVGPVIAGAGSLAILFDTVANVRFSQSGLITLCGLRAPESFACILIALGRNNEALTLAQAAVAVLDKALGPEHQSTKDSASTCADALDELGRTDEAVPLRARYGLKAELISLRRPVSRRVNRTGNSEDPKLIAELTRARI